MVGSFNFLFVGRVFFRLRPQIFFLGFVPYYTCTVTRMQPEPAKSDEKTMLILHLKHTSDPHAIRMEIVFKRTRA